MATSITTWVRLEPRCRTTDMSRGLQARVYDPLWLLGRQWQIGEFQGEDNGSPAAAQWRGEAARFTRYAPGPLADGTTIAGQVFDGADIPLETLVECEPLRARASELERLRFAADAGRHFLRLLEQQALSKSYVDAVLAGYAFAAPTDAERRQLDKDSAAFATLMAARVPDGRRLYQALDQSLRPHPPRLPSLPPTLTIAAADVAEVSTAGQLWLRWVDTLFTQPAATQPAWLPERMEYGFSLAARTSSGETVLTAGEYFSGRLDWHDFDINPGASLQAADPGPLAPQVRTTIPAPVTYRGMPAARFWEFEDARVDFGGVDAAPQDLARMLLVEFAITYGNDWFVLPIDLDVGSLCRTRSLIVTNTFGERFLIRSSHEAGPPYSTWRMFQLSTRAEFGPTAEGPAVLMLPHTVAATLESRAVEDVLFVRDEMANMAWGIERIVESPIERPRNRSDDARQATVPAAPPAGGTGRYQLASATPDNWIPLLPVQTDSGLRLQRGQVLKPDGTRQFVAAEGRILNPNDDGGALLLYEEEIPREGVRVTRTCQLTRWQDGGTHLWIGRRKRIGRGEGSSGLRFDRIIEP